MQWNNLVWRGGGPWTEACDDNSWHIISLFVYAENKPQKQQQSQQQQQNEEDKKQEEKEKFNPKELLEVSENVKSIEVAIYFICCVYFPGGESFGCGFEVPCSPPDVLTGEDRLSFAGLLHPLTQT